MCRRQNQLGDGLDLAHLEADLHDGVLAIRIPVAEQAKPRKISVGQSRTSAPEAIETTSASGSMHIRSQRPLSSSADASGRCTFGVTSPQQCRQQCSGHFGWSFLVGEQAGVGDHG